MSESHCSKCNREIVVSSYKMLDHYLCPMCFQEIKWILHQHLLKFLGEPHAL